MLFLSAPLSFCEKVNGVEVSPVRLLDVAMGAKKKQSAVAEQRTTTWVQSKDGETMVVSLDSDPCAPAHLPYHHFLHLHRSHPA